MKFKTTKKAIMNSGSKVYAIGYCNLQYLLRAYTPIAYTAGVYGWNADIYFIDSVYIVTGYRPFGESVDYEKQKLYNDLAASSEYYNDFDKIRLLMCAFIESIKAGENND